MSFVARLGRVAAKPSLSWMRAGSRYVSKRSKSGAGVLKDAPTDYSSVVNDPGPNGSGYDDDEPAYAAKGTEGYQTYAHSEPFATEYGGKLDNMDIAYETWGTLNPKKTNAILLHTGMSASSHAKSHSRNPAPGWWENFIGPGLALDTNLFYVICTNNLGGCYGSTGPAAINPETGKPYGSSFPLFSVQDQAPLTLLRAPRAAVTFSPSPRLSPGCSP